MTNNNGRNPNGGGRGTTGRGGGRGGRIPSGRNQGRGQARGGRGGRTGRGGRFPFPNQTNVRWQPNGNPGHQVNNESDWTNHNDGMMDDNQNHNNMYHNDEGNYNTNNDEFLDYSLRCYNISPAQKLNKSFTSSRSIIIDSASTSDIITNADLLTDIHIADQPLFVNTLNGVTKITKKGYLGEYPLPVWFNPSGQVNILSLYHVTMFFHVTMDTTDENCLVVHMNNGKKRNSPQQARDCISTN